MALTGLTLCKSQKNFILVVRIPWSKGNFACHAISAAAGSIPVMFLLWQLQVSDRYPKASNFHRSKATPGLVLSLPQALLRYQRMIYLSDKCGKRNGTGFIPLYPPWPSDWLIHTANLLTSSPVITTIAIGIYRVLVVWWALSYQSI